MIANKFTQAINATYGSNLKAVDLGIEYCFKITLI
jgi:hypothetical protein